MGFCARPRRGSYRRFPRPPCRHSGGGRIRSRGQLRPCIGSVFVGSLACADENNDDTVLSSPTALSMRCLYRLPASSALYSEYDMQVDKSKCMCFANYCGRSLFRDKECTLGLYGLPLEYVKSCTHLGHINDFFNVKWRWGYSIQAPLFDGPDQWCSVFLFMM
jgi:hypothetical protein